MDAKGTTELPGLDWFLALESQVWEALVTGDAQADASLLTADFLGVYPSGFSGRVDHAGQLDAGPVMRSYHLDQARLLRIGEKHALLSYRATYARIAGDTEVMFISSLWQLTGGRWRNSFSQDTPAA